MDIGNIIGPIIAGFVVSKYGFSVMWQIMTVFLFLSVAVILVFRKKIVTIETTFAENTMASVAHNSD
jgi:MFS family permease